MHFTTDTLTCTKKDIFGSHTLTLPYGSISTTRRIVSEQNGMLWVGGILSLLWGIAESLRALLQADMTGVLYCLPGLAAMILHHIAKTTVTYLNSDAGEIALLHDKNHEIILEEILIRRRKQLLDRYGNINFANDPTDEIRKFTWLHTENLIDATQLHEIIETIRNAKHHSPNTLQNHKGPCQ